MTSLSGLILTGKTEIHMCCSQNEGEIFEATLSSYPKSSGRKSLVSPGGHALA